MSSTVRDWYALLGVERSASDNEISAAADKLARTAAALAVTNVERSHQIRETVRSIRRDLLSDPDARRRYDQLLEGGGRPDPAPAPIATVQPQLRGPAVEGLAGRFKRFMKEGWTCPKCSTHCGPSDRFCVACGTDMKAVRDVPQVAQRPSCRTCGARFREGDRFCAGCGQALGT